jgi:DNA-binding transcriptional LysR family regulator
LIDDAFTAAGREPKVAVETDHRDAIAALVVAGAGTALLPRSSWRGPGGPRDRRHHGRFSQLIAGAERPTGRWRGALG